jgi:thiosulfate dehydrogenase (quinone) large subunit
MPTATRNRTGSDYEELTPTGGPSAASAWFVVALRLVMGGAFLSAGLGKLAIFAGEPFDASGYLLGSEGPLAGVFAAMATNPALIDVINVVVPTTQVLIGVALIVGAFVRLAALGGAIQMATFYLGSWDVAGPLGFVNSDLVYLVVFLALGAFAAGRVLGLDRYIERVELGDEALIERHPNLRYVLG